MFRSSVTAFYSLAKCLFYRRAFHRDTFNILFFLRLHVLSKGKKIIYRMSEILLAAEIAFGCLHRCMAQQELNLLQLATARVAQLRTGSPQVMRRNMLQARSLAATLDYVPHHILRDAFSPHLSRSRNSSKDPSLRTLAATIHRSSAALTHCGMGTVRMCPPLPIRSTTAQCLWRICTSSISKPTSSDLRKPRSEER